MWPASHITSVLLAGSRLLTTFAQRTFAFYEYTFLKPNNVNVRFILLVFVS